MKFKMWLSIAAVTLLSACGAPDESERPDKQGAAAAVDIDQGRELYTKNCSSCHGLMMNGTGQGPPLNHKIYEPGHHGDQAFYRAVKEGARAHHWNFGDMPPLPEVTTDEVTQIVAYVRDRQQKSGIH
ncbi:MAG: mono/diheme cytochrome c family protein [Motiliproteus sp.]|jgi:mono/diheme cytochrome c family protein